MKLFKEVLKKNKKMIIIYVIIGVIVTFLNLYIINYLQTILDAFTAGRLTITMIIFYGIIMLINNVLGYVDNYPEQKLKNGLYLDFKLLSLKKMKTIDFSEYQKIGTGKLIQRVEDGSAASRDVVFQFWLRLIRELIPTAVFSLLFIFMIEKKLILFAFIGYIIVIIITNIILKKLYSLKENILVNQEMLNKYLVRGFMELVVFRTNKKYDTEIEVASDGIKNIVNGKTKIKLVHEIFFTVFSMLVIVIQVILLFYILQTKSLSVGAVVVLISLINKLYEPIAIFNVEYIDYKLNMVTLKRYLNFLDLPDDEHLNKGKVLKKIDGDITIQNIDFSYGNKKIIENLSLTFNKGHSIALVGKSGSGKSTIIKQIMGLIKPDAGRILIDNNNLNDINLMSYYDFVSYVSQEAPIFDGTLKENLIFDKKISDSKIIEVLKLVCLESFYAKLEYGLDTELGEKGILMSGGERQRVALARLFFDDSKIIVLDEATSAIDNITEEIVMRNVIEKLSDRTIIIIAHRLNTLKYVDGILVLDDGKIIESGKYNELLERDSYFKQLYLSNSN